jgi:urease accessory protein
MAVRSRTVSKSRWSATRLVVTLPLLIAAGPALADPNGGQGSFLSGLTHPLGGADHLLAMVTVGLWAALSGGRALWLWPAAFVGSMLIGGCLGMAGLPLPLVEPAILASTIVLGALVAFAVHAPLWVGAALIALFGAAHGHAHGAEMPGLATPISYALGFALASAALHLVGLGLGWGAMQARMRPAIRAAGALAGLAGLSLVFG